MEESNSNFDALFFETIQIDSSAVNPARDEAFAKVQAELSNVNHPKPMLKMKVGYWCTRKYFSLANLQKQVSRTYR